VSLTAARARSTTPRSRPLRRPAPATAALALLLAAALVIRLRNIDHGLPFVYHADEAYHFTSRAVAMFHGRPDPGYFQNPSGYTYIVHLVLRFGYGHGWPFGSFDGLLREYRSDPTSIYVTARVVASVLCLVGVAALYGVGRRLWGAAEGLAAAAILAFAFLPVAYSRLALTDVAAFAPIAVALYATVRVLEDGGRRYALLAGGAIGLALGFKYTAGLLVVPLVCAFALRRERARDALRSLALAGATMVVVFVATTPYFLIDLHSALYELKVQYRAADMPKLGQARDGSVVFYLRSLTWGFGWAPAIAAAVGVGWLAREDRRRALVLAAFPVALFVYIATADRYFARWLMPAYPVLALLAGVALARVAARLPARPALRGGALLALLAGVLVQPVLADVRTGTVLGRQDTRQLARDFMARHLRAGTRVVVEPAVPVGFFAGRYVEGFGPPPKTAGDRAGSPTRFIRALTPARIDRYRRAGYCVVVVMSLVHDRALAGGYAAAAAYYRRLERSSRVLFRASPYRAGATPVPFDFDFSTHLYYPRAYARPGPEVTIYRLGGCPDPGAS
jgi:Dolichyl-phosphate-mannose-protein mannosyltransferase